MTVSTPSNPVVAEVQALAAARPDLLRFVADRGTDADGRHCFEIELPTGQLEPGRGGISVGPWERVILGLPTSFPMVPARSSVDHLRWAGAAHVLQGDRLCVHMDADREWEPAGGIRLYLDHLWQWFDDAVAGRFDPATSLYHPVGGVDHTSADTPTVVVRHDPFTARRVGRTWVLPRTRKRLDIVDAPESGALPAVWLRLRDPMPMGVSGNLRRLMVALMFPDRPGSAWPIAHRGLPLLPAITGVLHWTAVRLKPGQPLYVVLGVPFPEGGYHLLAGRVSYDDAGPLRSSPSPDHASLADSTVEWCSVNDQRPQTTRRRDASRPASAFVGTTVMLLGCGGLGSWIAEVLVRAGVAKLVMSDPGTVGGGLLVRQNFSERDVGHNKAHALRRRVKAISDRIDVEVDKGSYPSSLIGAERSEIDLVIDATVNRSIRLGAEEALWVSKNPPPLVSVAVDTKTASLGLMIVRASAAEPLAISDELAKETVAADPALEHFNVFWDEPQTGDQVLPAPGCSTPTFHGSAADLMGVAAAMTNVLAEHLSGAVSGVHLLAMPTSGAATSHRFIAAVGPEVN